MTRTRGAQLRHLSFFDHLATSRENGPSWLPAQAVLVLLRELDERFEYGAPRGASSKTIEALRSVVAQVDPRSLARRPLERIVHELNRSAGPRPRLLFGPLLALGHALQAEISPAVAADVFDSVARYAESGESAYAREAQSCLLNCTVRH